MRTQSYKTKRDQPSHPQSLMLGAFATRNEIKRAIRRFRIIRRKNIFFLPGPFMQALAAPLRRLGWQVPRVINRLTPCDYKDVRVVASLAKEFGLLP